MCHVVSQWLWWGWINWGQLYLNTLVFLYPTLQTLLWYFVSLCRYVWWPDLRWLDLNMFMVDSFLLCELYNGDGVIFCLSVQDRAYYMPKPKGRVGLLRPEWLLGRCVLSLLQVGHWSVLSLHIFDHCTNKLSFRILLVVIFCPRLQWLVRPRISVCYSSFC